MQSSATEFRFQMTSRIAFSPNPPYYNAVPYADLMDFFYVWLRRSIRRDWPRRSNPNCAPRTQKSVRCGMGSYSLSAKGPFVLRGRNDQGVDRRQAVCAPRGVGVVVFAHRSTARLGSPSPSRRNAGWVVTASWPIDTRWRLASEPKALLYCPRPSIWCVVRVNIKTVGAHG